MVGEIGSAVEDRIRGLRLMVFDFDGVFTDNMVYVLEDGRELVRCSRSDGLGLRRLEAVGVESLILSTEANPVVAARSRKLAVDCISGCDDKGARLAALLRDRGIEAGEVGYVGNDINDLECLKMVGLPIVVRDAHPEVVELAVCQTNKAGGHGAVREVCDLIYGLRSLDG